MLPPTPLTVYADRRRKLASQMQPDSIAIIPTAPEQRRSRDSDFPFRHDSYFYYLTGFTEPNAALVLRASGEATLFCQAKDESREIWEGYRLGPAQAIEQLGVQSAFDIQDMNTQVPQLLENTSCVYYPFYAPFADPTDGDSRISTHLDERITQWVAKTSQQARGGTTSPEQRRNLRPLMDEMRLIKDSHEITILRRAAEISAGAHIRAMQMSSQRIRNGLETREFHLEAELLHEFRFQGSEYPAYNSIVAAGSNACVLHYRADTALVQSGDLVLIDAGCELHGYASDITRTFPANGRFTDAQRQLYDIVLASQQAAIAQAVAGQRFHAPHEAALEVLCQGMLDMGLLDPNKVGSVQDVIEKQAYSQFYMHRTSHWMGMDVHDCGSYREPAADSIGTIQNSTPSTQARTPPRNDRILRPGMVITIEPGLYVRPAPDVPERYHGIGIRIEDDALITESQCDLMTRGVPVDPLDIEALMR